jgi:hypothetical protein
LLSLVLEFLFEMNLLKENGGNEAIGRFIDLVHDRPGIWDKSCEYYKVANKNNGRDKLFQEIASELNIPDLNSKSLKTAFDSLRTMFNRTKKTSVGKSGCSASEVAVDWPWFEQLSFLSTVTDSSSPFESTNTDALNFTISNEQSFAQDLNVENISAQITSPISSHSSSSTPQNLSSTPNNSTNIIPSRKRRYTKWKSQIQ